MGSSSPICRYRCDDKVVESCVKKLEGLVLEQGGVLDEGIQFCCEDGVLSINLPAGNRGNNVLLAIPKTTLLPVGQVEFGLSGDDIYIESCAPALTGAQRTLFDVMIELYNLTRKIVQHKENFLWIAGMRDDPAFFDRVTEGRTFEFEDDSLVRTTETDENKRVLNSFIKSRAIECRMERENEKTLVLMPLIDFVNHHPSVPGYKHRFDQRDDVWMKVLKALPVEGSTECFVNYGRYDAYDTLIHYGFVEPNARFVRSIPMEIAVSDFGVVKIHAHSGKTAHKKLPDEIADLHAFLPSFGLTREGYLEASSVMIPCGHSPHALRRVLGLLIRQAAKHVFPDLNGKELVAYVLNAEEQVISKNIAFYKSLQAYLHEYRGRMRGSVSYVSTLLMADIQLEKLAAYQGGGAEGLHAS